MAGDYFGSGDDEIRWGVWRMFLNIIMIRNRNYAAWGRKNESCLFIFKIILVVTCGIFLSTWGGVMWWDPLWIPFGISFWVLTYRGIILGNPFLGRTFSRIHVRGTQWRTTFGEPFWASDFVEPLLGTSVRVSSSGDQEITGWHYTHTHTHTHTIEKLQSCIFFSQSIVNMENKYFGI